MLGEMVENAQDKRTMKIEAILVQNIKSKKYSQASRKKTTTFAQLTLRDLPPLSAEGLAPESNPRFHPELASYSPTRREVHVNNH